MKKILEFLQKHKFFLFCFLLSFTILLFTSKNSFFYPFNDWVDANAFFTVGKSMVNGVVPYRDLFEQKGLLLYVIYAIGYLFSHKTFYAVFILEVLFFSVFLYYVHKIISLYIKEKYSFLILPILAFLITTSFEFVHGGSAEEFCFPMIAAAIYYFLRHFEKKKLNSKEFVILGILTGCVFMIKYTMLGFFIGVIFFLSIDFLRKKDWKFFFKNGIFFLLGCSIPITLCFIYLLYHHAWGAFIEDYLLINMKYYSAGMSASILEKFKSMISILCTSLVYGNVLPKILFMWFLVLLIPIRTNKFVKFSIIGLFMIAFLVNYWGLKAYVYYFLPMYIFLLFPLLGIFSFLDRHYPFIFSDLVLKFTAPIVFVLSIIIGYEGANYREMLFKDRKDMFQYQYAEYIQQFENPTLLNMGFLDAGLYTTTGIVPNTKFFEVQNLSYDIFPDNLDDMRKNVEEQNIMFILYVTSGDFEYVQRSAYYIFDSYDLVKSSSYVYEGAMMNAFLFQVKPES